MAYALAMALTLVYTGEHYVVDVLAGWAVAALAILVATAARPDGYRRRSGSVPGPAEEGTMSTELSHGRGTPAPSSAASSVRPTPARRWR